MTRYLPARHYLWLGITAVVLAVFSAWVGWQSPLAFIPAFLFLLTATFLFLMASRPAIEVHEGSEEKPQLVRYSDLKDLKFAPHEITGKLTRHVLEPEAEEPGDPARVLARPAEPKA